MQNLEAYGDVRGEIVVFGDYDIGVCRGCKNCTSTVASGAIASVTYETF